jgi:hypothetical protein
VIHFARISLPLLSEDQRPNVAKHLKAILSLSQHDDLVIRASLDYLITWINGQEYAAVPQTIVADLLRRRGAHWYVVLQSLSCPIAALVEQAQEIVNKELAELGDDALPVIDVGEEEEVRVEWIDYNEEGVFDALRILACANTSQISQARKTMPVIFRKAGLNTLELY